MGDLEHQGLFSCAHLPGCQITWLGFVLLPGEDGAPSVPVSAQQTLSSGPLPFASETWAVVHLILDSMASEIGSIVYFCLIFLLQIYVPLMLVNAADDPLVHESLLTIPKSLSGKCSLSHSAHCPGKFCHLYPAVTP